MLSSPNIFSFGMPFFDLPTIGSKKWDGSRWVSKDSQSYSDGTYRFDAFGEGGIDSPGLSDGFGDAAGLSGTSSLAGNRAADAMVGSFGQAALSAGAKTGLGMAFGMSPTNALAMGAQSLASPGTLGGIVGAGINAGLGLSSLGPTQAALAGIAGVLGGPLAAAAVAAFGGFVTNAIADFADVRDFENVKDLTEDAYGHSIKGLSVGETLANVAKGYSDTAPEVADLSFGQTLADMGLATSVQGVRGFYGALENDLYGELASTMSLSPEAQVARDSFGILGGLAQTNYGIPDADVNPAPTSVQGGEDSEPSADIGAPDSAIGSIAGAMAADAAATQSLSDTFGESISNALSAAAEAESMSNDADADSDTGGNSDAGDPNGGMGDPAADGLNSADPGDTGSDGFGSSDPGAAGVGSGSVGGL